MVCAVFWFHVGLTCSIDILLNKLDLKHQSNRSIVNRYSKFFIAVIAHTLVGRSSPTVVIVDQDDPIVEVLIQGGLIIEFGQVDLLVEVVSQVGTIIGFNQVGSLVDMLLADLKLLRS
ncbi:hypothetical protein VNO80_15808 [Phaseolus coccineus]|uniref:Secreted protein n=1 Tax=Phaseolus coccineus TaxID=3886 RepID=A0AAN9MKI9_PHACN